MYIYLYTLYIYIYLHTITIHIFPINFLFPYQQNHGSVDLYYIPRLAQTLATRSDLVSQELGKELGVLQVAVGWG